MRQHLVLRHVGDAEPIDGREKAHGEVVEDELTLAPNLDLPAVLLKAPGEQSAVGRQPRVDATMGGQVLR